MNVLNNHASYDPALYLETSQAPAASEDLIVEDKPAKEIIGQGEDDPSSRSSHVCSSNLQLPIPSSENYFDNYHHPLFPLVLPALHTFLDLRTQPYMWPEPLGPLPANDYDVLGARLHDWRHVNTHPRCRFTKWMLWYLEVEDDLFDLICPSDLNDMPCEWDELQGGCSMLRICHVGAGLVSSFLNTDEMQIKRKYPHPHLGVLQSCLAAYRYNCRFVHDIETSCRSINKQLLLSAPQRFRTWQRCDRVAQGELCHWGHDFEKARADAVYRYWEHRRAAKEMGSRGVIKSDVWGRDIAWKPVCPLDLRSSKSLEIPSEHPEE